MKPNNLIGRLIFGVFSVGLFLGFTVSLMAQVETVTTTASGQATKEVSVERGEVVYVAGNDLVVKMENGEIRHFPNVPESSKVDVNGQMLGIHDLKPGMKLQRTITTTTTPQLITKVETISGRVFSVTPPSRVTITMENNQNHVFKIPEGTKFNIGGQETDAWGLRKGMQVHITSVMETPATQVAEQRYTTGTMPPPPPPEVAMLIEEPMPAPEAAPAPAAEQTMAEAEPESLPATGSTLPAIGLLGVLMLTLGFGLRAIRATR